MIAITWPTADQLQHMGFERCKHDGCSTWINPALTPSGRCRTHWIEHRKEQRPTRPSGRRLRYATA